MSPTRTTAFDKALNVHLSFTKKMPAENSSIILLIPKLNSINCSYFTAGSQQCFSHHCAQSSFTTASWFSGQRIKHMLKLIAFVYYWDLILSWTERQAKVLIVVAWSLAFLFSIPTLIIFGKRQLSNGEVQCWAVWPDDSYWIPYMTTVAFLVYFIPLIIIR